MYHRGRMKLCGSSEKSNARRYGGIDWFEANCTESFILDVSNDNVPDVHDHLSQLHCTYFIVLNWFEP